MEDSSDAASRVSCIKCRYYQITWDAQMPYGCRAHGFKTHRNPALIVYESSGIECQLFRPKGRKRDEGNPEPE